MPPLGGPAWAEAVSLIVPALAPASFSVKNKELRRAVKSAANNGLSVETKSARSGS